LDSKEREPVQLGQFSEESILAEAKRQYDEAQAAIDIEPGKTALVVVDMMDEFVKPNWCPYWVPDATRQVPKIRALIDAFHDADLPVIFTAYEVSLRGLNFPTTEWVVPIGAGLGDFVGQIFDEVRIYEPIAPAGNDLVVLKHCYSPFYGTELDLVLKSLGVTTIVVCGTMTNYCCGATAREGFWHGYRVIFGSDVNSSDDPALHDAEIRTLRRGFARIMSSEEILAGIRSLRADPVGASA
jgi:nicotinamidase-related amidase